MEIDSFVLSCVHTLLGTMKGTVLSGEGIEPQVMMFGRENGAPAICPMLGVSEFFHSKKGKSLLKPIIKATWTKISGDRPGLQLLAVIVLSDARVQTVLTKEFESMGRDLKALFEKPGVTEALVVQVSLAEGDISYLWPYVRSGKDIVFAPESTTMERPRGSSSLVADLWPIS